MGLLRVFRRSLPKKGLFIGIVCLANLMFLFSLVGRTDEHRRRGLGRGPRDRVTGGPQPGAGSGVTTRSNVVYITLRSKRLKAAHRRDLARSAPRERATRTETTRQDVKPRARHGYVDPKIHEFLSDGADSRISSIRLYSQSAPPWFSAHDLERMRFLADANVLRVKEIPLKDAPSLLLFEGEASTINSSTSEGGKVCGGQCGTIRGPQDHSEVFAFHLDRVLGLNRTLPAVSRKFHFMQGGNPRPVVSWDALLYPEASAAGPIPVRLTWRDYQHSLAQKCGLKSTTGCFNVHHFEWSKLALFDFLLQIHSRLDASCCGFRPQPGDKCVKLERRSACEDPDSTQLVNLIQRGQEHTTLVFTNNKGCFERSEDNLDFRLLEGIKELPEEAVSVLRNRKLREKLLQSLFLDQTYWMSQGGRSGVDSLIDVVEKRAEVLLAYINAHGIKIISMI